MQRGWKSYKKGGGIDYGKVNGKNSSTMQK